VKTTEKDLFLRVTEALTGDVYKGIARVPLDDMARLGVTLGDVIEIKGGGSTVAKAVPLPQAYQRQRIIQIDGTIRRNANVELGDKIALDKIPYQDAKTIVLSPIDVERLFGQEPDIKAIKKTLTDIPIVIGDKVKVTLFGQVLSFLVEGTAPDGAVMVRSATKVILKSGETISERGFRVYYEDIGGLDKEIQKIREIIEFPLKYPRIFSKLGIKAPNGILLHGPPGTGKTLIARAIASETSAYFVHLNGPEVMHKFYGESEARLREFFEGAKQNAPSIIFLDEIDAIAPRRAQVIGDVEKRVVAQLLALMDGLVDRGDVIIIGATNIPDVLDPALRRPGRLDREITIPVPNEEGRLKILGIHTRGMPLAEDVDLDKLAEITHGFVGADLAALCREAGMNAFRRMLSKVESGLSPSKAASEVKVTMADFREGLKEVEPSAMREYSLERSKVKMADIGGLDKIKQDLISLVKWPLKYAEFYEYSDLTNPRGIMFIGPTGTGKTLMAKALANESEVSFISINGPSLFSKWLGESEKTLREVFKKAKQSAPCILFFDEIDAIAPVRGKGREDSNVAERMVSQLLTELDGLEGYKGVIVLGATNRPDLLDPALLRPGRFDFIFQFQLPNEKERYEIFRVHTRKRPVSTDVDLRHLAKIAAGFSGSDIASICVKAATLALRDFLGAHRRLYDREDLQELRISRKHFSKAIEDVMGVREELGESSEEAESVFKQAISK